MASADAAATAEVVRERLAAHGAVLFGASRCQYTAQMRKMLGLSGGEGDAIPFVACDATAEAGALCERMGITMTPTLVFAGTAIKGVMSLAGLAEATALAPRVAEALAARGAVLYGRDSCAWTARQQKVLGVAAGSVAYVNCDAAAARCAADGVTAVPAWRIDGSEPIYGYRRLPELTTLASLDAALLAREAANAATALAAGTAAADALH